MDAGIFLNVIYVLLSLLCALFFLILGYVIYKNRNVANKKRWQQHIQLLISDALFGQQQGLSPTTHSRMLRNKRFRQCLIEELLQVKKNLAGDAGISLCELYESLGLDVDSSIKLKSIRWHIKAKGIQELSVMQQTKYVKKIFRLSNHSHELVRNEAQCGLVNFYGFPGLRFLNVINYSLSQWQQIQLLNKMNGQIPEDMSAMKKWLQSSNESLVIFSLKLASHYNCAELQKEVIACLNRGYRVRIHVMDYLINMPTSDIGDILLADYDDQCRQSKLLTLKTLREVGNESHTLRLVGFLEGEEEELIAEILETLLVLNPPGSFRSSLINETIQAAPFHILTNEYAA